MTDNQSSAGKLSPAIAWGIVAILLVIAVWFAYLQDNSQPGPPVSGGMPAPVVPQFPDLAGDLREAKSRCEGLGRAVRQMVREGRRDRAKLDEGRQLYTAAKADYDECIDYICTAMTRRFTDVDPDQIKKRMERTNDKMKSFTTWAYRQISPQARAFGPLGEALDHLDAFLAGMNKENEEAIRKVKVELEACRLVDWSALD